MTRGSNVRIIAAFVVASLPCVAGACSSGKAPPAMGVGTRFSAVLEGEDGVQRVLYVLGKGEIRAKDSSALKQAIKMPSTAFVLMGGKDARVSAQFASVMPGQHTLCAIPTSQSVGEVQWTDHLPVACVVLSVAEGNPTKTIVLSLQRGTPRGATE